MLKAHTGRDLDRLGLTAEVKVMGCCQALFGGGSLKGADAESTLPRAQLSGQYKGEDVTITKQTVVSGSGTVLADTALHQDQAYFEVLLLKVPEGGAKFCQCRGFARREARGATRSQTRAQSYTVSRDGKRH